MLRERKKTKVKKAKLRLPPFHDKDEGSPSQPPSSALEEESDIDQPVPSDHDASERDSVVLQFPSKAKRESPSPLPPEDDPESDAEATTDPTSSNQMTEPPTREEITAQLAAVEARGDTKLERVLGEMRTGFATIDGKFAALNTRLDGLNRSTSGTKTTVILTGIAIAGVIVAILAYGQAWFGLGMSTRDTVKSAISEYIQQSTPQKK